MLIMSAFMLMSSAAFADWTEPTITGQAPVVDNETEQYLYNTGAKAFFLGANDWNTRASLSATKGYKVKFKSVEETEFVEILDYCETKNNWYNVAAWSPTDIYVDRASQNGWQDFKLVTVGETTFNIWQESNAGNWAVGSESFATDTRIYYDIDADHVIGTPLNVWTTVSEEEYTTYAAKMSAYVAAKELKAAIDAAKAKYPTLDLAAEEAVYNNEESTVEELNAAIASVAEKVKAADIASAEQNASPENPVDLSNQITNATFDNQTYEGWEGSGFGKGGETGPCAERYNMNFDTYQVLSNMPNGVYRLTVDGFYRPGSDAGKSWTSFQNGTDQNALIYACGGEGSDEISTPVMNIFTGIQPGVTVATVSTNVVNYTVGDYTYTIPNSMKSTCEYIDAGYYKTNTVIFAVKDGTVKIGAKKTTTITNDWTLLDNFALTFYGNSENSFAYWMEQYVANMPANAYDAEDLLVTGSYVEAYKSAISNATGAKTYDAVMANITAINSAKAAIVENMAAWQELLAEKAEAEKTANNSDIECNEKYDLGDYIEEDVQNAIAALELTTEEIRAMIATLKQMTADAIAAGLKVGSEIEIKNYDFSDKSGAGWTFTPSVTGINAHCAESWNQSSFDYYQIVEGAPAGVYTITMQGFYRAGNNDVAWPAYYDAETGEKKDNVADVNAFVYLNDSKNRIANLYSEQVPNGEVYSTKADYEAANGTGTFVGPEPYQDPLGEYWYPNGMTTAGEAFDEGFYQVSASGLVGKNVPMRIGVKGSTANAAWAIFTRFHLVYMGFDATIIKPMLEAELAALNTSGLVGAELAEQIATVKADANTALAGTDGKTMYEALLSIYAIEETIEESAAVFVELINRNNDLANAITTAVASTTTKTEASVLWTEIDDAINNATYTTEQAKEKLQDIKNMIGKLAIPANAENATDEAPVDLTSVIQTPSFDKDGINSVDGWTVNGGYNFGNDDTQKSALCLEFYEKDFNLYQDLSYLPAGTYSVAANGFFRPGASSTSTPILYANADLATADSVTVNMVIRDSVYSVDPICNGETGLYNEGEEVAYGYVPNDMVSAGMYFDFGLYKNELIVKVNESGKLRIGMSATNHVSTDWVIMDNFTLTYYGANSTKEEGGLTAIEEIVTSKVCKIEIFNLNGQKVNVAENGIFVVRMTLENGEVVTSKVVK